MRRTLQLVLLVMLVSCGVAQAGPILLASLSNTYVGTEPSILEEYLAGDRLLYTFVDYPSMADLFEDTRILIRPDEPPVTVSQSVTPADDPDFVVIASMLTDGFSSADGGGMGFQEIAVLGLIGGEDILDVHVPRNSEYDLLGYVVERIDREVTFSMRTIVGGPDGDCTEVYAGGVYEIGGSVVPEPATLWLLAAGVILVMRRSLGV
ncbi:MAG: PEP-CTERM sorting domain-containing protein [Planctomycetes bacterium]|nr:PEP-CTERM sorting domain-containing protein [Planctomycetota bacterium]